jgi:hypothetical protein
LQVGIHHKQEESSVEELDYEDTVSDQASLLRQSVIANTDDKLDDDNTKNVVDSNN